MPGFSRTASWEGPCTSRFQIVLTPSSLPFVERRTVVLLLKG